MAKVDILLKGYNLKHGDYDNYTSTCTLVRDKGINVVVDPGSPKKGEIDKALKRLGLEKDNIDYVFITHYHPDHARDVALFPKAKLVDIWEIIEDDRYDYIRYNHKLTSNVTILRTPGHAKEHGSLKVKTDEGIVVVAGDVWWYENFTPQKDPYAWNQKKLEESRKKILKIADFIILGHGGMVKNPYK